MIRKNTLLIDGNNMGFMAFGTAPLSYEGERTEVISIGLSMIKNFISDFEPDRCIVVWDGGRDAERLELYPEYKQRKKEPTKTEKKERDLFFIQMNKLIAILSRLGIEQYKLVKPKREADDVIYSLIHAKILLEDIFSVISSDKDFFQLFTSPAEVVLYSPIKKLLINKELAEEMYKIPMDQFLNYRGLVGDPSDNLPGVKGIGPAKAVWLVKNILDEDTAIRTEFGPSERRAIDLLSAGYEQFDLMKKLIEFKLIGQEELERGRLENGVDSIAQLQEELLGVCDEYGLARIEQNFVSFIQPFEMLYKKRRMG